LISPDLEFLPMAQARSFRAEMTGLSERDRTLLRSLLQATQARTDIHWETAWNLPRVFFIDVDSDEGRDAWQSLLEDDRRSAIVIAQTAPFEDANWLPKPLRSTALIDALRKIGAGKIPTTAPKMEATPIAGPTVAPSEPPPKRLLEWIETAANTTTQSLRSSHWPDLVLAGGGTRIMRTAPIEDYLNGFAASLDVENVVKYTGGPLPDEQSVSLDLLRWMALIHAPLDQIEHRLPNPAYVRLESLPDFGHLPHSLAHVRMAVMLTQRAASPQELVEAFRVDEETVRRFLGACAAVGLLVEAPMPAPIADVVVPALYDALEQQPTPRTADTRSLLERLRAAHVQAK
jgi:hypothetical protein